MITSMHTHKHIRVLALCAALHLSVSGMEERMSFALLAPNQLPVRIDREQLNFLTYQRQREGLSEAQAMRLAQAELMLPGAPESYSIWARDSILKNHSLRQSVHAGIAEAFMAMLNPLPQTISPARLRRVFQYATNSYKPIELWQEFQDLMTNQAYRPSQAMQQALIDNADEVWQNVHANIPAFLQQCENLLPSNIITSLEDDIRENLRNGLPPAQALQKAFDAA